MAKKITKDMLISEALECGNKEAMAGVLFGFGMHCLGCAMAHHENLEQACAVHGLDADAIVVEMNAFLEEN